MASGDSASSPIAIASPAPTSSSPGVGSPCPILLAPRASPALLPQQPQPAVTCDGESLSPGVVTHKEWVVPPRPKPGRKPATDTPPTKRKAQNRAAQRAFRERRAARVNELEDRLKDVASETESKTQEFKDQIALLTQNNSELTKENAQYRLKVETLQKELQEAKAAAAAPAVSDVELTQVASPAPSAGGSGDSPCGGDCTCQDAIDRVLCDRPAAIPVHLPKRALPQHHHDHHHQQQQQQQQDQQDILGCGSCTPGGKCACFDAATAAPKRSTSPTAEQPPKRTRTLDFLDDLETDFTATYMRPQQSDTPHIADPCGFCSDGTPCVCAEMARAMDMEDSDAESVPHANHVKLAPILPAAAAGPGVLSPPASSAGDYAVPLRRMAGLDRPLPPLHHPQLKSAAPSSSSGCKPGGCDQCKADPMSTLFCQSVASRISNRADDGGCCGGSGADRRGGCCRDIEAVVPGKPATRGNSNMKPAAAAAAAAAAASADGGRSYIPCSAAYQTLSRHRAFDAAAADLGALVRPLVIQSVDGRCPQVEVSSVRDVLKMLDRRFGRD